MNTLQPFSLSLLSCHVSLRVSTATSERTANLSLTYRIDGHADPGQRPLEGVPSGSAFHQPAPEAQMSPQQMEQPNSEKRTDNLSNDHATLTQIASAAAAAGVR
jgi:hypothetical protein